MTEEEMEQQARHHERRKAASANDFPTKFWITTHNGKIHDVLGAGGAYHIQHVVKNPKAFGFASDKDMIDERLKEAIAHANLRGHSEPQESPNYTSGDSPIDDLETYKKEVKTGIRDIDHHVETAAMKKGGVRGTAYLDGWQHSVNLEASSPEHIAKALTLILPHIERSERENRTIDVNYDIYPHGKGAPFSETEVTDITGLKRKRYKALGWQGSPLLKSSRDIKNHIELLKAQASQSAPAPAPPAEESDAPVGKVGGLGSSTVERAKGMKSLKRAGMPTWQAQRRLEGELGSWGDSVEYRGTFKSFFKEMLERNKKGSWQVNSDIQRAEKPKKGNKK